MKEVMTVTGGRSEFDGRNTDKPSVSLIFNLQHYYTEFLYDVKWRGADPTFTISRDFKQETSYDWLRLEEFLRKKGFIVDKDLIGESK